MGPNGIHSRVAPFGLHAIEGFTMDALNGVIKSVPEWHTLLDNLNSQIAQRQFELAELDKENNRPPTRSLKPKGSMESLLRPKDTDDDLLPDNEDENASGAQNNPSNAQTETRDTTTSSPAAPASPTMPTTFSNSPPRIFHHSSSPGPAPLQRYGSGRVNKTNITSKTTLPTVLRKRKTESINSAESQAPKYRTRSMIIVYYDSAVQHAFEEVVKLISVSRNAMRRGKMAARMANMKKMAELDTDSEDEASPVAKDASNGTGHTVTPTPTTAAEKCLEPSPIAKGNGLEPDDVDQTLPVLEFVSTRRMGPSRDSPAAAALRNVNNGPSGMRRRVPFPGYRGNSVPAASDSFSSIFDELDSGLEWSQSMCEHAAHQFLRDGTCSTEIVGIKKRLLDVKEIAEREVAKVEAEKKEEPKEAMADINGAKRVEESRGMKPIQMRKPFTAIKSLESDQIEVDDEGYDDMLPPMQWRPTVGNILW